MQSKDLYFEQRKFLKALLKDISYEEKKEKEGVKNEFYHNYNQTIKSQFVLMLYTTLESVVMQSIQDIFDKIKQEKRNFYMLNKNLKKIYVKSKVMNRDRSFNDILGDNKNSFLTQLECIKHKNCIIDINCNKDFGHQNPFGTGSLDYYKITESILKTLNIEYEVLNEGINLASKNYKYNIRENIKEIKEARNKLAHGEQSFQDFGKDKSINDIEKYFVSINIFLYFYLKNIQIYIDNRNYLRDK